MSTDPTAKSPPAGHVFVGQLGRTFQLEGALRWHVPAALEVADFSGEPLSARAVATAGRVFVTGLGEVRVRAVRTPKAGGQLLLLEGVRDRNAAQRLVNAEVWLDPALLAGDLAAELDEAMETPSEEEALVGLSVLVAGQRVGSVASADLSGPNAVAAVALEAGGSALIPLAAPYVSVTHDAVVLTDPPPGLLEAE